MRNSFIAGMVSSAGGLVRELTADVRTAATVAGARRLYGVSLFRNAFYLLLHWGSSSLLGFVFWIVVARLNSTEDVGRASAAISALSMIGLFANLGLGYEIIRFLSEAGDRRHDLVNSSLTLGTIASLLAAVVFLAGLSFWSPALLFLRESPLYAIAFVAGAVGFNLITISGDALVANRRSDFALSNALVNGGVRLPAVILLGLAFSTFAIIASWAIALWVAVLVTVVVMLPIVQKGYRPRPLIDRQLVGKTFGYALSNYVSMLLLVAPGYLFPVLIINIIGMEANAHFYAAWLIMNFLIGIIGATSLSLFAEGSHQGEHMDLNLRRVIKLIGLTLAPAVIIVLVLADKVLLIFGAGYSDSGATLLRLFALSTLPLAVTQMLISVLRIEKRMVALIGMSCLIAVAMIGVSTAFIPIMGINAVGVGFLSTHGVIAAVVAIFWLRSRAGRSSLKSSLI